MASISKADRRTNADNDATAAGARGVISYSKTLGFNGTSYDRWRNNFSESILASAARTATIISSTFTNFNARSMIVELNITAAPTVETLTFAVQYRSPVATTDFLTYGATSADADTGKHIVIIDPSGGADVPNAQQTVRSDIPAGQSYRVVVTHSASGSWTYSVGVTYFV